MAKKKVKERNDKPSLGVTVESLGTTKRSEGQDGNFEALLNVSLKLVGPTIADMRWLDRARKTQQGLYLGAADQIGIVSSLKAGLNQELSADLVMHGPSMATIGRLFNALSSAETLEISEAQASFPESEDSDSEAK